MRSCSRVAAKLKPKECLLEPDVVNLFRDSSDRDRDEPTAELFAALYDELHRLAKRQLSRSDGALTLGATTLVHEAYLNLSNRRGADFPDRARFIAYAARAMRGIVIDYVRYSKAAKRGGGAWEITFTGSLGVASQEDAVGELERLSEALDTLASIEPSLAELVDLHFFCGYELREIAELRGVTERTAQRSWRKARLLLRHQMLTERERGS
jgi:RNA polymerase sigma factor (TIGR02999 family)